MKKALTNNLWLKVLSIVAALMLWLVVVNIDDPVTTKEISDITVTMLNEEAITSKGKVYKIEDESNIIDIKVSGKRSVLKKLTAADFIATADMEKDIKYGDLVGIKVTCTNTNVKDTDIIFKSWENVKVSIEDSKTDQFTVVVNQTGTPGSGYVVGEALPEQNLIQITGPASIINKIKRVEAKLDVTGLTSDQTVLCTLSVLNSDGDALDTTYLNYNGKTDGMKVKITMLETKMVNLNIEVGGTPAEGYGYAGVTYLPETIEIAGSDSIISGISKITIPEEAVNIDDAAGDVELVININDYLPAGVRLVDEADATIVVTVEIEKQQGRTFSIPLSDIVMENVPKGFTASFDTEDTIRISVMGTSADLDALDAATITLSMDLSSYTKEGTYTQKLSVDIPGDFYLEEDVEVEFVLTKTTATDTDTGTDDTEVPADGTTDDGSSTTDGTGAADGGTTADGSTVEGV